MCTNCAKLEQRSSLNRRLFEDGLVICVDCVCVCMCVGWGAWDTGEEMELESIARC